ncbi:hypothetical protein LTR47_000834 [Exophiala xenobiotica]|nr:hypothetical protein LTR41_001226 [Exophiala xenobiotica]KAK5231320.1 hypothetical protein LTR72_000501 [Exophiala xenobiotica]KAK5237742.1 hypothetical protein LTR47_000834 [Exophiala xenobiotica]KAK5248654.1 hypothetical protein LTS06_006344 [Exophiala xenobiotica]KAK5299834.1 hypothetical protein LTR14_002049 [Exophiala xenobiotica]
MTSTKAPCHPREVWEAWKGTIAQMYLRENKTCGEIRTHLLGKNFPCSERQIKNRLSEWKFECKKTPSQHYLAMLVVAEAYPADGYEVMFDVPKRHDREVFSLKKIKKECDRVKKKCHKDRTRFGPPSLEDAQRILCDANIRVNWEPTGTQPLFQPCVCHKGNDNTYCYGANCSAEVGRCSVDGWTYQAPEPVNSSFSTNYSSPSIMSSHRCSPSCVNTPCTAFSDDKLHASSMVSSGTKDLGSRSVHIIRENISHTPPPDDPEPPSESAELASLHAALDLKLGLSSPPASLCDEEEPMPDFDFSQVLDTNDSEEENGDGGIGGPWRWRKDNMNLHRMNVCGWAAPYYWQFFQECTDPTTLKLSKRQSIHILQQSLRDDKNLLYPCLDWVLAVLGSQNRMAELKDFISTSCTVIDNDPELRKNKAFAVPFHYAMAFANYDYTQMDHWGNELSNAYLEVRNRWGERHPNSLVVAHFCAWHALHCRQFDEAVTLLTHSLPICEEVMGRHNLLTINCLTILSRAFEEAQNIDGAMVYLQSALSRFVSKRPDLEKLRLILVQRLALIQLRHTNDLHSAEQNLLQVLCARGFLGGLDSKQTWSTIHRLGELFFTTGRIQQGHTLIDYCTKRLNWQRAHDDDCCHAPREKPPDLPWWWPFEVRDATGRRSFRMLC